MHRLTCKKTVEAPSSPGATTGSNITPVEVLSACQPGPYGVKRPPPPVPAVCASPPLTAAASAARPLGIGTTPHHRPSARLTSGTCRRSHSPPS